MQEGHHRLAEHTYWERTGWEHTGFAYLSLLLFLPHTLKKEAKKVEGFLKIWLNDAELGLAFISICELCCEFSIWSLHARGQQQRSGQQGQLM